MEEVARRAPHDGGARSGNEGGVWARGTQAGGARLLAFPAVTREYLLRRDDAGPAARAVAAFELRPGARAGDADASDGAHPLCLQLAALFALGQVDRVIFSAEGYFESVALVSEHSPEEDLLRALDKVQSWALQISARRLGETLPAVFPSSSSAPHDELPAGTPSGVSKGRAALRAAVEHLSPIMARLVESSAGEGGRGGYIAPESVARPGLKLLECVCDTAAAVAAVDDLVGGGELVEDVMVGAGLPAALVRLLASQLSAAGDAMKPPSADAAPGGVGRDVCSRTSASLRAICCSTASDGRGHGARVENGVGRDGGKGLRPAAIRDVIAAGIADVASVAIRDGAPCGDSLSLLCRTIGRYTYYIIIGRYIHMHTHTQTHIHTLTHSHAHTLTCMYICTCMYIYTYVCIHILRPN